MLWRDTSCACRATPLLGDGSNLYIYGPDGVPVEHITTAGVATYYHHDQLGSTRLLTSSAGATVATFSYDAYGTLAGSTGTATTPVGFAGEYTDSETGFQYLRARYYDPATGQFVSRDPMVADTRAAYAYASGNPTNRTDPSGLATIGFCISGGFNLFGVVGANGSACVQASTSGDIGASGTAGVQVGAGSPDIHLGPGLQYSNADHISQLGGPFAQAGGSAAVGLGAYGEGFVGRDSCGNRITGGTVGPAVGVGVEGHAGPTYTGTVSVNVPHVIQAIGNGVSSGVSTAVNTVGHGVGTAGHVVSSVVSSLNPF